MIVISGALVLVALVLLVLGLTMTDLNFVYGSIAVSLVSFVFLVIGILQRRGEPAPDTAPAVTEDGDAAPPAEVVPARSARTRAVSAPEPADDGVVEDEETDELVGDGATVLVVPGRPRYHVDGCRYLAGKDVEEVDVDVAREEYSPCGVCKPEDALALAEEPAEAEEDVVDSGVPGAEDSDADLEAEPVVPARARSSRSRTATQAVPATPRRRRPAASAAAEPAEPAEPAEEAAPAPRKAARRTAAAVAVDAAPAAPAKAAPAKAAAKRGRVVVIPDRGRFHQADCRFVRDALGTEELTRTQAAKQGYAPCGVCKP